MGLAVRTEKRTRTLRVFFVWLIAIWLTVLFASLWYITQPLTHVTINYSQDITEDLGVNTTGSANMYSVLGFTADIGFPALIVAVWVWAYVSSQAEDWRSEEL